MSTIQIHPISALKDNYIWAIINTAHREVLIVDPGDATPVLHYLKHHQLELKGILITHHHWDHVNGVNALINHHQAPVFGSELSPFPLLTRRLSENDVVSINTHFPTFQVLAIPGHTLDHVAYYDAHHLFCGDTLFGAGCGRLFEGNADQLHASLQRIAALPLQTKLFCAHEYTLNNLRFAATVEPDNPAIQLRINQVTQLRNNALPSLPSTLMEEMQTNPFLRCEIPAVIHRVAQHSQRTLDRPEAVFMELRQWKDVY